MIEKIIKDYLDGHLLLPSFFERPEHPPEKYILLEKTGSSESNYINSATFVFQSYAPSLYEAAELNEELKSSVKKIIEVTDVSKAKLNTDYNFTDPEIHEYRYQAVFDFKY